MCGWHAAGVFNGRFVYKAVVSGEHMVERQRAPKKPQLAYSVSSKDIGSLISDAGSLSPRVDVHRVRPI